MSADALKAAATGQIQKTENPAAGFTRFLDRFKPQMALALPKFMNADRMSRLAVTAFSTSPKLQQCDPKTIAGSIMTACTLGLEIGVQGQGFLVPYGKTCTFVPGWKGLVDLVSRSGRGTVWTGAVFEGDDFDYALGDNPFIKHKPGDEDDPKKMTHVYAVGRAKGSDYPIIEVWRVSKVYKHLSKYNKVGGSHYALKDGGKDFEMYARKIPLLQVLKYMPQSVELAAAIEQTHAAEAGQYSTIDQDFMLVPDLPEEEQQNQSGPSETKSTETVTEPEKIVPATPKQFDSNADLETRKNYESVAAQIHKSLNLDQLDEACDLIKTVSNQALQDELINMYKVRKGELDEIVARHVANATNQSSSPEAPAKRTRRTPGAPE